MAHDGGAARPIARALLSVDDKSGLADFARGLARWHVELVATEGTRRALTAADVPSRSAEELTGIGNWFGGRIKTLHPGLLAGILAPRTDAGARELADRGLLPIDLVAVTFYPFEKHLAEAPEADDRAEFVDIGGVTLARAAAKNHDAVTVLVDPEEYGPLLAEMEATHGQVSAATRTRLAVRAFRRCAEYDQAIAQGLAALAGPAGPFPDELRLQREPIPLRYGENPHQPAASFGAARPSASGLTPDPVRVLKGPALSYTNFIDLDAALSIVGEFPTPTAAVVKHATPAGVASGATIVEALERAISTDPIARYGCVVAVNRTLETDLSAALRGVFVDLLAAPSFSETARAALARREKIKLVEAAPAAADRPRWEARSALGRLLVQEADRRQLLPTEFRRVTTHAASPAEACALDFAWRVVRHAKSNAIVLAHGSSTVGVGSGQTSRVKAVELAVQIAGPRARGSVLASDAFFPFADGVEVAAAAGVRAILQPGGSVRDAEVFRAAERAGLAMYCTGWRVFRH